MNQETALVITVALSLSLSAVIWIFLARSLRAVLQKLCPDPVSTRFWMAFTALMLTVTPLFFTLSFSDTAPMSTISTVVRTGLASSLFGSGAALLVVGYQIAKGRPRLQDNRPA
jgi:hypothetical protein